MKKNISLFTIIFIVQSATAQEAKLLQNFKYRINNFRAINLGTDAGTGKYNDTINNGNRVYGDFKIGGTLYNLKSTDKKRLITNTGLYSGLDAYKDINDFRSNSNQFYGSYNISLVNYGNHGFWQVGTDILGHYGTTKSHNLRNIITTNNGENKSLNVVVTLGIGKGRLENITDMQNALWLHRALLEDKNITRKLTDAELNSLGRAITKANNTRVLDFRRRNKFLLKTVDNFLQEKNVIDKTNIDYFNNLNDILFFAIRNQRFAGKEIYLRVMPSVISSNNFYKQTVNNSNNNYFETRINKENNKFVTFKAGIDKAIPIGLKHQNNYGGFIQADFGKFKSDYKNNYNNVLTNSQENLRESNSFGLGFYYNYGYSPNTRTNIFFNNSINLGKNTLNKISNYFININSGVSVNYFISYRTRLIAELNVNYNQNKNYNLPLNYGQNGLRILSRVGVEINL